MVERMNVAIKTAIAQIASLPESDQERIGRDLLAHVEKLRALRGELEPAIRSIERGEGREVNIEEIIARARGEHAGS